MRTDEELQQDVLDELRWDPVTRTEEIAVVVRDGVVTLGGSVGSYAKRLAAERAAERVSGVHVVADDLVVSLPGTLRRSDTEIAHQVRDALRWDVLVPHDAIKARVQDGWVTLEGQVEWDFERRAATAAVRNLTGVRGVTPLITLRVRVSPHDVSERIRDALARRAQLDAHRIDVEASDGTVVLRGTVPSRAARREAEQAAWNAAGVTRVDARLGVQR